MNEAKMVKESRSANKAKVGGGIRPGAAVEKSLVRCASFHKDRPRFADDAPMNLVVPWVVVEAGLARTVDKDVSTVLAIM